MIIPLILDLPHVLPITSELPGSQTLTFPPASAGETLLGTYVYGEVASTGEVVSFRVVVRDVEGKGEADLVVCVDDEYREEFLDVPLQANISHILCAAQAHIRDCQGLPFRWDDDEDDDEDDGHVLGRGVPLPVPKELILVGGDLRVEVDDGVVYYPSNGRIVSHTWRRAYQLLQAG